MRDAQGRELQRVVEDRLPEFSSSYLHYLGERIALVLRERDRKQRPMTKDDIEERYQANRPGMLRHLGDVITSQEFTDFAREEQDKFRKRLERETADIQRQRERARRERERLERLRSQIAPEADATDQAPIEEDKHEDYHEPGYEDRLRREMEKLRRAKEWDASDQGASRAGARAEEEGSKPNASDLHDYAKRLETARQQRERFENLKPHFAQEEGMPTMVDARSGLEKRLSYIEEVITELRQRTARNGLDLKELQKGQQGAHQHSVDAMAQIRREMTPMHQKAKENEAVLELHRPRIHELGERVDMHSRRIDKLEREREVAATRDDLDKLRAELKMYSHRRAFDVNQRMNDALGELGDRVEKLEREREVASNYDAHQLAERVEKLEGHMLQGDGVLVSREWARGQARREEIYALKQAINLVANASSVSIAPYRKTLDGYLDQVGPPPEGEREG